MRRKHRILFLLLLICLCIAGCGKQEKKEGQKTEIKQEATLLGVEFDRIDTCIVYHGEFRQEIDLTTEEGKDFLEQLSGYFEKNKHRMGITDWYPDLSKWSELEEFAQKTENQDNYYVLFQFSSQQTVSYLETYDPKTNGGELEEREAGFDNCDGIMLDVNEMLINCSREEEFFETLMISSYADIAREGFSEVYDAFVDLE